MTATVERATRACSDSATGRRTDVPEPEELVLGRVRLRWAGCAIVTLNRPHADNAVTTELAAQLIEILETIDARASVRVAILTECR